MHDNTLKAVLDEDFENFLKSLNVYDSIKAGSEKCCICEKPVSFSSISALFPHQSKVFFCCDSPACISKLKEMGNQHNG